MQAIIDIEKIITASRKGGQVLSRYFNTVLEIEEKRAASDVRTVADTEAEQVIIESLQADFPGYSFYAEETGRMMTDSRYCFVVDPLDGSNNFVLGIPFFSVSIALFEHDRLIAGVVYQPIIDKIYWAQASQGAYADGQRLEVSREADITRATIAAPYAYDTSIDEIISLENNVRRTRVKRLLNSWSTALDLCLLAEGRIESVIVSGSELYDVAAGKIIAQEAGAILTGFDSQASEDESTRFVVSANQTIHDQIFEKILQ